MRIIGLIFIILLTAQTIWAVEILPWASGTSYHTRNCNLGLMKYDKFYDSFNQADSLEVLLQQIKDKRYILDINYTLYGDSNYRQLAVLKNFKLLSNNRISLDMGAFSFTYDPPNGSTINSLGILSKESSRLILAEGIKLRPTNLKSEIIKSELVEYEALMRKHSAAIMTIEDFIELRLSKQLKKGPLFGRGMNYHGVYNGIVKFSGCEHWLDVYERLNISPSEIKTAEVMSSVTSEDKPIYFLVPPEIISDEGFTTRELLWLLNNPSKMKNVHFIFGGYEFIGAENYLHLHLSSTQEIKIIEEFDWVVNILKNYKKYLK